MAPKWNFLPTPKGGVNADASTDNFFMNESGTVVDNLVRENIQNALDAQAGQRAVKVRFALHQTPKASVELVKDLLSNPDHSVIGHYRKAVEEKEGDPSEVNLGKPTFLVIEDFNTKGLSGDIKSSEEGGFAMFWRNTGISDKSRGGNRGGSFGIGKVVNPMASAINTFFGITVRKTDRETVGAGPYLMGQTMLRTHKYSGKRYQPYALFGEIRSDFELPVENENYIAKFCAASGIIRQGNEAGFSLAIPYPKEEFDQESTLKAVITHYLYPIAEGRLVVEVAMDGNPVVVDARSLPKLASSISDQLEGEVRFAQAIIEEKERGKKAPSMKLIRANMLRLPITSELFTPEQLSELRGSYEAGELVAIEVPIETERRTEKVIEESSIMVYLRKSQKPSTHYIRGGISVHKNPKIPSHIKAQALLLAESGEIAEFLRKSEGPAHEEWFQKNSQAIQIFANARDTVGFVKTLLPGIASLLENDLADEDVNILADDFPDSDSAGSTADDDDPAEEREIESSPDFVQVSRRVNGEVVITKGPAMEDRENLGKACEITLQYLSAMRGAKWRPFDFDLARLSIEATGTNIRMAKGNKLQITLTNDFKIVIPGLDKRKDVKVGAKLAN